MIEAKLHIGEERNPIYIGSGLKDKLNTILNPIIEKKSIFLLSEENVFALYGKEVLNSLDYATQKFHYCIIGAGENNKSIDNYTKVISRLIDGEYTRDSVIIALGGGVIGDLAGFAASTYMRGIDVIHIPTTLLAAVDSSIGGKTGINHEGYKNLLGTFYHPRAVVIDTSMLKTLSNKDYLGAFGEIIKYGMLGDLDLLVELDKNSRKYINRLIDLDEIILKCVKMKINIVDSDERDHNKRKVLNLGHTFAHGIESSTDFNVLSHGEAVAIGLLLASRLSLSLNKIKKDYYSFIEGLLYKYFAQVFEISLNAEEILKFMQMDKKNKHNYITFVLPTNECKVDIFDNISRNEIKKCIMEANNGLKGK